MTPPRPERNLKYRNVLITDKNVTALKNADHVRVGPVPNYFLMHEGLARIVNGQRPRTGPRTGPQRA